MHSLYSNIDIITLRRKDYEISLEKIKRYMCEKNSKIVVEAVMSSETIVDVGEKLNDRGLHNYCSKL